MGFGTARKAWVALVLGCVLAALYAVQTALGDGVISVLEWVTIAIAVVGVPAAVYQTPNDPPYLAEP